MTRCGRVHALAIPKNGSRNNTPTDDTTFLYELEDQSLLSLSNPIIDPTKTNFTNKTFPSSFQIKRKLNQTNYPIFNATLRVVEPGKVSYLNISGGLQDKLIYDIYVTIENDFQVYSVLLENRSVAHLEAKTLKRRSKIQKIIKKKKYLFLIFITFFIAPLNIYSINFSLRNSIDFIATIIICLLYFNME